MDRFLLATNPLNLKDPSEYIIDTVAGIIHKPHPDGIEFIKSFHENNSQESISSSEKQAIRWYRSHEEQKKKS